MGWRFYKFFATAIVLLTVSGCSDVRPLYGTSSANYSDSVQVHLADIKIPEPRDRVEQLIRNELISLMSPPGTPGNGQYSLLLKPIYREQSSYVANSSEVGRRIFYLKVEYTLFDSGTRKELYKGKTFSEVSYDRISSKFANLQARTNAEERASTEVAQDIRTRLAAYFSKHQGGQLTPGGLLAQN